MTADRYILMIENRLLPQARVWLNGQEYIFQQDNAPCHTAHSVKCFFLEENIAVPPWPRNSPDMSPIETLLAIITQKLEANTLTNKYNLIRNVLNITQCDNGVKQQLDNTCQKLPFSMLERIQALVKGNGDHTKF